MAVDYEWGVGDTGPLDGILSDVNGPVDLSGTAVTLTLVGPNGTAVFVDRACTLPGPTGQASCTIDTGEIASAGSYTLQFKVVDPAGNVSHFPNNEFLVLQATATLG